MNETQTISPKTQAINLSKHWQTIGPNTYPLDLDQLIEGTFKNSSFSDQLNIDKQVFNSFEGALLRTENTRTWTILLNRAVENERRRRFTFAHELGHFMCHRELQDKFEDSADSINDFHTDIENQANEFASWLLMPANLLREEFFDSTWSTETLCEIGNRFETSLQASAIRYVDMAKKPVAFIVSRDGMILWAKKNASAPFLSSYCFGDELPQASKAMMGNTNGSIITEPCNVGHAWSNKMTASESQYFDYSGKGYQYTCIEFSE